MRLCCSFRLILFVSIDNSVSLQTILQGYDWHLVEFSWRYYLIKLKSFSWVNTTKINGATVTDIIYSDDNEDGNDDDNGDDSPAMLSGLTQRTTFGLLYLVSIMKAKSA